MSNASRSAAPQSSALRRFLATEAASGSLLVGATVVALAWANSPWRASYDTVWHTEVALHVGRFGVAEDLRHWVNEGLMAVFFLVVGLEVKREFLMGELRDRRKAAFPIFGALGGMLVPALIFLALNPASPDRRGWGIPMATDIAFAVGVLALCARSAPAGVRLFLLTLAIVDDIGAVLVIAIFYSDSVDLVWLAIAAGVVLGVVVLRRFEVLGNPVFVTLGVFMWLALRAAHVHPSLAGVAMGLLVPAVPALTREIIESRSDALVDVFTPRAAQETTRLAKQAVSLLEWLEHHLHGWSSLVVVPIFALANAGLELSGGALSDAATSPITIGVMMGLVVGKLVGIAGAALLAERLGWAERPDGATVRVVAGVAALGGIGFTVSLFIATLAYESATLSREATIGVMASSLLAAALGALLLRDANPRSA